jgi:hypothetical protein
MALHDTTAENPTPYASLAQMLDEHKTTFLLQVAAELVGSSPILISSRRFITMEADKRQCLQEVGALLEALADYEFSKPTSLTYRSPAADQKQANSPQCFAGLLARAFRTYFASWGLCV